MSQEGHEIAIKNGTSNLRSLEIRNHHNTPLVSILLAQVQYSLPDHLVSAGIPCRDEERTGGRISSGRDSRFGGEIDVGRRERSFDR